MFSKTELFYNQFLSSKLVKSHGRNERSDLARPGIRGGCGGLTNFFSRCAKAPPLCYLKQGAQWLKVPQKSVSTHGHKFLLMGRDYVRILIPRGLLVMDCLFFLLFPFLNPQIPGGG